METLIIVSGEGSSKRKLRQLADWSAHGFQLIAEIHGRDDAVSFIISKSPSLALLDVSLPLTELRDIMEISRSRGYSGHFFLVSSKSDFKAAQAALKYGADRFFVTPIDPAAFAAELKALRMRIAAEKNHNEVFDFYRTRAKNDILRELVLSGKVPSKDAVQGLGFDADAYQVAVFESLVPESISVFPSFSELVRASGFDGIMFDSFRFSIGEVVLLKGALSIELVRELVQEQSIKEQSGSGFFISLGGCVNSLASVNLSYSQARYAYDRRFLTPEGTRVLSYETSIALKKNELSSAQMEIFKKKLIDGLQAFKRHNLLDIMAALQDYLISTQATSSDAKMFLIDLFLQIKESFMRIYSTANIPFASNTEILTLINRKSFLHDVLAFYSDQFNLIMSSIGSTSRDSVLDDVFYYISHNYSDSIKLESLASLFGYNSAYLGKIFHKAAGMSFNNYVDKLRVEHSMTLLRDGDLKVYEIARQVGYKSVDYYHKKFRAQTGESPAEYRKRVQSEDE